MEWTRVEDRREEVASRERERRVVGTFCTPAFPSAINWPRRVLLSAENASKASDDASLTFSPRGLKAGESRAFPLVSHQQVWLIMRRLPPRREEREREREKGRRKVGARLLTLERPDVLTARRFDIFRRGTVCCWRMISKLETLIFFRSLSRIPSFRDNCI